MDFQIGEKIIYPMHGAGIIEAIEEKEILGTIQQYYKLSINKVVVMFPLKTNIGIRPVVTPTTMDKVLASFYDEEIEATPINRTQRIRIHMNKMKTGDIFDGAEVIRDLMRMKQKKSLATGDKRLLENAQQILLSELMLVKDIEEEEATIMLQNAIGSA